MSDTFLGYLLATGALLLFTTAILSTKVASSRINLGTGFLIATTTNVIFSALALVVQLALQRRGVQWNWTAFALFALAGAFSTYLGRWFFYESVVRFGPAKASIFQVSSPLFTALIAWLVLGEKLTLLMACGMLMTVFGLMLVSYKRSRPGPALAPADPEVAVPAAPSGARKSHLHERVLRSFFVLGLGSSLAYAVGNVLRGSAIRSWDEPVLGALAGAACGLALHLAFSSGKRELWRTLPTVSRSGAWLYALVGVSTIGGQMGTIAAMRYIPVSVATLVTLCTPILIFPISHFLFKNHEELTATTWAGSLLTLAGIAIIVMR
jgi:drug/metabolite transporter (DMT)-like permease